MVQTMSGMTLAQAQAQLDALLAAQGAGNFRSVTFNGRTVMYSTPAEMIEAVTYWRRTVAELQRKASGRSRHSVSHADFSVRR
jgi:hypothetical protein